MQTPSAEHAEAPDTMNSQSDATGDDVHDHVPLVALASIVTSPGGARHRKLTHFPEFASSNFPATAALFDGASRG